MLLLPPARWSFLPTTSPRSLPPSLSSCRSPFTTTLPSASALFPLSKLFLLLTSVYFISVPVLAASPSCTAPDFSILRSHKQTGRGSTRARGLRRVGICAGSDTVASEMERETRRHTARKASDWWPLKSHQPITRGALSVDVFLCD